MAALTADRNTPRREGDVLSLSVAAGKTIYAGALVARNSNGHAVPGKTEAGILGIGRAEAQADNSSGEDGALSVEVRKGVFRFDNSSGAERITSADIGSGCFIVDDRTVAKTGGEGARSAAGTVFDVDAEGVWVKFE